MHSVTGLNSQVIWFKYTHFAFNYKEKLPFVNCKLIPRQAKIRFVAESATLLLFFDFCTVSDSKNEKLKHCIAQSLSKSRQICGNCSSICGILNSLLIHKNKTRLLVSGRSPECSGCFLRSMRQ